MEAESAGSALSDLIPEDVYAYATEGVETGDAAANISGIQKLDDKTVRVVLTEVSAPALQTMDTRSHRFIIMVMRASTITITTSSVSQRVIFPQSARRRPLRLALVRMSSRATRTRQYISRRMSHTTREHRLPRNSSSRRPLRQISFRVLFRVR